MQKKYSDIITSFLQSRPAMKADPVEVELSIPQGTINKALRGIRPIPVKHIFPIICLLAGYGMKIEGYTLSYDPADGLLSGRNLNTHFKKQPDEKTIFRKGSS